jgi:hypothetical protein
MPYHLSLLTFYLLITLPLKSNCISCARSGRSLNKETTCKFLFRICIGRQDDMNKDAWFMILQNVFHNGHGTEHPYLRKPLRLQSTEDLHLVRSAMNVCAGEGVARALYYHRKGEVLDRSALNRLSTTKEDSTLERGTAAEALLHDLR